MSPTSFKLLATKSSKCKKDFVFRLSISENTYVHNDRVSFSRNFLERKFDDLDNNLNLVRNIIKCCEICRCAGEGWRQILKKIVSKAKSMPSAHADQISKAVLRTQPPHAEDVPSMVAYSAKFGGAPNGVWINDLIHYCTLAKMPAEIHIPGRLFEAIAKFDFDTEMPGRAVTAILKRAAMSTKVIDGVVADVRVTDVTGIMNKEKKAMFLKANRIMEKMAKLLDDKQIPDPQRTLDEGKLQRDLIDVVMANRKAKKLQERRRHHFGKCNREVHQRPFR